MATINLTLNDIQIPAISGYTPPLGTKKASGGLSTREVNDNIIAPFTKPRPINVTESSTTSTVEHDSTLVIGTSGATITLGSGAYSGVEVKVIAMNAGTVAYVNYSGSSISDYLQVGTVVTYIWNATYWVPSRELNLTYPPTGVEIRTGMIYNNSRVCIYGFDLTINSSSTEKSYEHGAPLGSGSAIIDIKGFSDTNSPKFYPVNYSSGSGYFSAYADRTYMYVATNISGLYGRSAHIWLYYTH